jgi:hypothetical protein
LIPFARSNFKLAVFPRISSKAFESECDGSVKYHKGVSPDIYRKAMATNEWGRPGIDTHPEAG